MGVVAETVRARGGRLVALVLALGGAAGCSMLAGSNEAPEPPAVAAAVEIPVPPAPPPAADDASLAPAAARMSAGAATRIERVTVESTPPTTRVVLELDGGAEPEVSLLVNQRLVIDVPGTTCAALPRVIEVAGDPLVERVRTGQHAAPVVKSRVVVDLRERADFTVRTHGDRIVVLLAPADTAGTAAVPTAGQVILGAEPGGSARTGATHAIAAAVAAPEGTPSAGTPSAVPGSDATPGALVATPEPSPPPTPAPVPEAAPTPDPVAAASATPASPAPVASVPSGDGAEEEPSSAQAAAETAAPTPDVPTPQVEATRRAERISIDFTEADVRTVIDLIAAAGGYRVIFTPEVGGTISITLVDRPWEDALATVLRAKRLREVRHEDVMLVSAAGR